MTGDHSFMAAALAGCQVISFVADVLAAFDDRAIPNHGAERRLIKHLAIDDAAILKGEMDKCTVLCWWLWLEFYYRCLPIRGV
jgi:hypothetical protein